MNKTEKLADELNMKVIRKIEKASGKLIYLLFWKEHDDRSYKPQAMGWSWQYIYHWLLRNRDWIKEKNDMDEAEQFYYKQLEANQ